MIHFWGVQQMILYINVSDYNPYVQLLWYWRSIDLPQIMARINSLAICFDQHSTLLKLFFLLSNSTKDDSQARKFTLKVKKNFNLQASTNRSFWQLSNHRSLFGQLKNFLLKETFWFCTTALTPQGGGVHPKNMSGIEMNTKNRLC